MYMITSLSLSLSQEAKLSQETLADTVVKTNEEKYNLNEKLEAANKVCMCTLFQKFHVHIYVCVCECVHTCINLLYC